MWERLALTYVTPPWSGKESLALYETYVNVTCLLDAEVVCSINLFVYLIFLSLDRDEISIDGVTRNIYERVKDAVI